MNSQYSQHDIESDPILAVPEIADSLKNEQLALFLGAGVSKGFGLPTWNELVAKLLGRGEDIDYIDSLKEKGDAEMRKLIDPVESSLDRAQFIQSVHKALYSSIEADISVRLTQSPTLLAVAALISGRCRGRVTQVVTYNFDDLLQSYLSLLGLRTNTRTSPDDLAAYADVEVNHVHGFLPREGDLDLSMDLILSEKSYRRKRSQIDSDWSEFVFSTCRRHVTLFLGLSGDDSSILDCFERLKAKSNRGGSRTGYWILTPDAYERNRTAISDVGICPISLDVSQIPKFIFEVCKAAV